MCNLNEGIFEKCRLAFAIDTYLDGLTTKEYIMGKFNLSADELEDAMRL